VRFEEVQPAAELVVLLVERAAGHHYPYLHGISEPFKSEIRPTVPSEPAGRPFPSLHCRAPALTPQFIATSEFIRQVWAPPARRHPACLWRYDSGGHFQCLHFQRSWSASSESSSCGVAARVRSSRPR